MAACLCLRSFNRQRGAIGLFASLVLILAILFVALAIDTARLALDKQQLQRIADLSALHAVSTLTCGGSEETPVTTVAMAAQQVAAENGYSGDLTAEAGAVTLGSTQTVAGVRQFSAAAGSHGFDAVRVIVTADAPKSLIMPGFITGDVRLQAMAVASKQVRAGFKLGSFLLGLNTGDSILDPLLSALLGSSIDLSLASYQAIAGANVSLLQLINAAAGVGTLDELLNLDLSVTQFIQVLVDAVGQNSTAGLALNQLGIGIAPLPTIRLGELLAVGGAHDGAALDAQINVLELLAAGLQLANKQHAVEVQGVGVNLPPLAQVGLKLYVIDPPKIAIGYPGKDSDGQWRTTAQTAQLRLQLDLSALNLTLGATPESAISTSVKLSLYLDAAKATAHLESVQCPTPSDPNYHVTIDTQPSIVSLGVGQYADIDNAVLQPSPALEVTVPNLTTVPPTKLTVARVAVSATAAAQNPEPDDLVFAVAQTPIPTPPPDDLTQRVGTDLGDGLGNAVATLLTTLDLQLDILPELHNPLLVAVELIVEGLLSGLTAILAPLLQGLITVAGDILLDPLLTALGVQLGGAEVTVILLDAQPTLLAI